MASSRLRPGVLLSIWVIAGLVLSLDPVYMRTINNETLILNLPWDRLATEMRRYAQPGDTLIFYLPEPVPNWMHAPVAGYYLHDLPIRHEVVDSPEGKTEEAYHEEARDFVGDARHIWIARQPNDLPLPIVDEAFQRVFTERGFASCGSLFNAEDLDVSLYVRTAEDISYHVRFGDALTVQLLEPFPTMPASALPVLLAWSVPDSFPPHTYSVGLHVENADGQLVRQADYGVPASSTACSPTYISLEGLPAGIYELLVTVYAWETGERLPATRIETGEQRDRLALGRFSMR